MPIISNVNVVEEGWRQVIILPDGDPAFMWGPELPGEDPSVYFNKDAKVSTIGLELEDTKTVIRISDTCVFSVHAARPERTEALVQSAIGTQFEHASPTPRYPVLVISAPPLRVARCAANDAAEPCASDHAKPDLWWAAIYILFELLHAQEFIPIILDADLNSHIATALETYLLHSGLARRALPTTRPPPPSSTYSPNPNPAPTDPHLLFLDRASFWQGAGTGPTWPNPRGWLRPIPTHPNPYIQYTPFPHTQAFTRNDRVIAQHPLRTPVPPPGSVLYARYCAEMRKVLRFHVLDPESPFDGDGGGDSDAKAFHRWVNDPRVNTAWGEAGTQEQHRAYMRRVSSDTRVLPLVMSWDSERMGYSEIIWIKEDHIAPYVPTGAHDYDRGIHIIMGEEKFRGNSQVWYRSLNHFVFLADPRTIRIVGEPREDNEAIKHLCLKSSLHFESYFYLPYKYAIMTFNQRERFFKLDIFKDRQWLDTLEGPRSSNRDSSYRRTAKL